MKRKKIMLVFGTRPEAIKMVPVILELIKHSDVFHPILVSTGQHKEMLDQILGLFKISPDYDLEIMAKEQSISDIVSKSLQGLDKIIKKEKPDALLVQGDTSSAFAAGLSAFYHKVMLGHVEAGLRTYNKFNPYPEEMNRKLISHIADLHFAPTKRSCDNLIAEKIPKKSVFLTGNTVIDALMLAIKKPFNLKKIGLSFPGRRIILLTAHRRESFGAPLAAICRAILKISKNYKNTTQIVMPVHRNPNVRKIIDSMLKGKSNISLIDPLNYHPFVHLMNQSYLILTDSGGIQEEAPSMGKPVLVLRETTERPEAIEAGTVKLIGTKENKIVAEAERLLNNKKKYDEMSKAVNPYGDGRAAQRIVEILGIKL